MGCVCIGAALAAGAQLEPQKPTIRPGADVSIQKTDALHENTKLVVVDVTVRGKNGQPVHGLKSSDFTVSEDQVPQQIREFEEHTSLHPPASAPALPPLPPLPPGTFTDYTPVAPSAALNVLLIDSLNTSLRDQSYLRYELQQFVNNTTPGTRMAIIALGRRLYMLQGFTSNPEILRNVLGHKLIPRVAPLAQAPSISEGNSGARLHTPSSVESIDQGMADVAANLSQAELREEGIDEQTRAVLTLAAFNDLAHYLSAFPGRKNIIWFAGSFPADVFPQPAKHTGIVLPKQDEAEFRQTARLLASDRIAVYPVDTADLNTLSTYSAQHHISHALDKTFTADKTARNAVVDQIAEDTGGRAFFNSNDLAEAVTRAIEDGSNFYTLAYVPANTSRNRGYRHIHIALAPALQSSGDTLSYRAGYYADDASQTVSASATANPYDTAPSAIARDSYVRAAIARGAPAPAEILFSARVLPAAAGLSQTLAPDNHPDPVVPIQPPFRQYVIDLSVVGHDLHITHAADGRYTGKVEFIALLYTADGQLLNEAGKTVVLDMHPETYARFEQSALQTLLEISAPPHRETYLRLVVHDVTTNRFGVIEIPIAEVSALPPARLVSTPPPSSVKPATH